MTSSESLFPLLQRLKQAADLHTNRLGQALALQVITDPQAAHRIDQVRDSYRQKRDFFETCLRRHFEGIAQWRCPEGGLFFWLRLNTSEPIDTRALLAEALKHKVAFMPGEAFHATPTKDSFIRLNFSHATRSQTNQGLETLAKLIKSKQKENPAPTQKR